MVAPANSRASRALRQARTWAQGEGAELGRGVEPREGDEFADVGLIGAPGKGDIGGITPCFTSRVFHETSSSASQGFIQSSQLSRYEP